MRRPGLARRAVQALARLPFELARAIVLLTAFGLAMAAAIAILGRFSRAADLLSHFALLGAIASTFVFIVAMAVFVKGPRTAPALAFAGMVAWCLLLAPDYVAALTARHVSRGGDMIKIVQFNVWVDSIDQQATNAWLIKQDADVVVVEEILPGTARMLKARYPYAVGCYDPNACSTMVFSKTPPVQSGGYAIPFQRVNLAWATFGAAAPFTVVGVHHAWPYPIGDQTEQVSATARLLGRFDKSSLIVAGDFNSTPSSAGMARQDRLFGLERRTHATPTWPAWLFSHHPFHFPAPFLALDHIYAGSSWKTVSVQRGPRLGSDHYPVVVTLRRI